MSELSASHCTARRLARASRKAYHTGSRSGYSSWSSSLNRRKAPLPRIARASLRPARSSVIASAKSAMSWYQTQDGSGSMTTRSSSSRSTGACPSMPVSAAQNAISPVSGRCDVHRRTSVSMTWPRSAPTTPVNPGRMALRTRSNKTPWQGDPRVNIQRGKDGNAKAYQVRQVLDAIAKLESEKNEEGDDDA